VALDPLPSGEALAAHHEASYADGAYATFGAAAPVRAIIARQRVTMVARFAAPGPWLDVGASTGAFVAAAREAGHDAEGIELSAAAVARATAYGIPVRRAAVESFVPSRAYTLVTAFDLIEHLPAPFDFLARAADWLAPGGRLALTLPNAASMAARTLGRHWFYYAAPDHVHYFTPASVRRCLARAGFEILALRPVTKPLPLDYATEQLRTLAPALAPAVRLAAAALPGRWRTRALPMPLGEMLVVAQRASATPHAAA
jgi:2-polyprenyl-3-methyl-5-hydroxy-6-metoxy-1,4-benzoquinol methylase